MSEGWCELKGCKSGQPAAIRVNENIDDGSWRVGICAKCAAGLGLRKDDDLPDAHTVELTLRALYEPTRKYPKAAP